MQHWLNHVCILISQPHGYFTATVKSGSIRNVGVPTWLFLGMVFSLSYQGLNITESTVHPEEEIINTLEGLLAQDYGIIAQPLYGQFMVDIFTYKGPLTNLQGIQEYSRWKSFAKFASDLSFAVGRNIINNTIKSIIDRVVFPPQLPSILIGGASYVDGIFPVCGKTAFLSTTEFVKELYFDLLNRTQMINSQIVVTRSGTFQEQDVGFTVQGWKPLLRRLQFLLQSGIMTEHIGIADYVEGLSIFRWNAQSTARNTFKAGGPTNTPSSSSSETNTFALAVIVVAGWSVSAISLALEFATPLFRSCNLSAKFKCHCCSQADV